MDTSLTVSVASFGVSTLALIVSAFLSLRAVRMARTSNEIQVVAEMFREARSREFRAHYRAIINAQWPQDLALGMDALDVTTWESAHRLCGFFEHLGVLVHHGLVDREIVLDSMDFTLSTSWLALQPLIKAERERRARVYPPESCPSFLPRFEELVRLTNGRWTPAEIQADDRDLPI